MIVDHKLFVQKTLEIHLIVMLQACDVSGDVVVTS